MDADDEELDDEEEEDDEENFPKHSTLEQCKIEIANMCNALMSSPEKHVSFSCSRTLLGQILDKVEGVYLVSRVTCDAEDFHTIRSRLKEKFITKKTSNLVLALLAR